MSYQTFPDAWSECSNSDFESFYRKEGHSCLKRKKSDFDCKEDEEGSKSLLENFKLENVHGFVTIQV